MLIVIEQLILNADDITLIKGDCDTKETKISHFKWLKPKTWFLEPDTKTSYEYYLLIAYIKSGKNQTFRYNTDSYKSVQGYMDKIAGQLKLQLAAKDQEMLDKVFEDAIRGDDK